MVFGNRFKEIKQLLQYFYQTPQSNILYNNQLATKRMDMFRAEFQACGLLEPLGTAKQDIYTSGSHNLQDIPIQYWLQGSMSAQNEFIQDLKVPPQEKYIAQKLFVNQQTFGLAVDEIHISQDQQPQFQPQQDSRHLFQPIQAPKFQHQKKDLNTFLNLYLSQRGDFFSQPKPEKPKKNSNTIKKIGRIILSNIEEFDIQGSSNEGVLKMLRELAKTENGNRKTKQIKDSFNISQLQALFFTCSSSISSHNLRTLNSLLRRKLRSQTLKSIQIQSSNKLIYLNTLKCSALRCCNRELAVRLQISQKR